MTIKISTLESMLKESRKCDSLRVAYQLKSATIDTLILNNAKMFGMISQEKEKQMKLEARLNEINKQNLKLATRSRRGWIIPTLIGITGGVILGSSF